MYSNNTKVGVVGAGIIGLSCALRIQQDLPNVSVTLIADKFTPNTTSDGAAGIWAPPSKLGGTSPQNIYKWGKGSHDWYHELWKTDNGGLLGISMVPCFRVSSSEDYAEPAWKDVVFGFRSLTPKELGKLGKPSLRKGFGFTTFTCESSKLLPEYMRRFVKAGGNVEERKVNDILELRHEFDIAVNCTGVQAHFVAEDKSVVPKRGQLMRVEAPNIKWAIVDDDDDGSYVIPNQENVVLGATYEEGNWNLQLNAEDTEWIKNKCFKTIPSLKDAPVLREWVGLRPGRPSVRLDLEVFRYPGEKPFFVCSNYGHGGSGVTLSWGCANDTVELVRAAILQRTSKL